MQRVADRYATQSLKVEPGERLHRLVALLFDTHYDDLTTDRIRQLEELAESGRWMNADGDRV